MYTLEIYEEEAQAIAVQVLAEHYKDLLTNGLCDTVERERMLIDAYRAVLEYNTTKGQREEMGICTK